MGSVSRPLHPALRRYVARCVGYDYRLPADAVHHGLPSTALTLIWAFDEPLDCGWLGAPSADRYWTLVAGLHTAPSLVRTHGVQVGLQLSLTPQGARALLGTPAAALASTLVSGEDVGLPAALHARIAGAERWSVRFDLVEAWLLGRLGPERADAHPAAAAAWRRLTAAGARVEAAAAEIGVSRRHLRNLVVREFGLTPTEVMRVARFGRAVALAEGGVPLADVAARAGYADQPHLNREWRRLAGRTPTDTLAEFPVVQDDWAG